MRTDRNLLFARPPVLGAAQVSAGGWQVVGQASRLTTTRRPPLLWAYGILGRGILLIWLDQAIYFLAPMGNRRRPGESMRLCPR